MLKYLNLRAVSGCPVANCIRVTCKTLSDFSFFFRGREIFIKSAIVLRFEIWQWFFWFDYLASLCICVHYAERRCWRVREVRTSNWTLPVQIDFVCPSGHRRCSPQLYDDMETHRTIYESVPFSGIHDTKDQLLKRYIPHRIFQDAQFVAFIHSWFIRHWPIF